jgi:hypothetical protein
MVYRCLCGHEQEIEGLCPDCQVSLAKYCVYCDQPVDECMCGDNEEELKSEEVAA